MPEASSQNRGLRTLVIQLGRLGDVIQTTPLLRDLAAHAPERPVDLLIVDDNTEAIEGLPGIDRLMAVPANLSVLDDEIARGFQHQEIPGEAWDLLASLGLPAYNQVINASHAALGCWIAGQIPAVVHQGGVMIDAATGLAAAGECLYFGDAQVYRVAELAFRNQNSFNLVDLLRAAGAEPGRCLSPPAAGSRPYIHVHPELPFALPAGRRVALNPGASEANKRWPAANFARLAGLLKARGPTPILVGAPADYDLCAEIQAASGSENFCGQTSIPQMARLMSEVDLLISNDTGAVHIAAAVGTPVLALCGGSTHFSETAPWGDGHLILQGPLDSIVPDLPLELVVGAAACQLGLIAESELRQMLRSQGAATPVTAWETRFLPRAADPLGGLTYRPIHAPHLPASDIRTWDPESNGKGHHFEGPHFQGITGLVERGLRHLLARSFCASQTDSSTVVSLEYLRDWFEAPELQCWAKELPRLALDVTRQVDTLEKMAEAAGDCLLRCQRLDSEAAREITGLTQLLMAGLDQLKRFSAGHPASKPVIQLLDWKLRMMPSKSPSLTFEHHQKQYQSAAQTLRDVLALVKGFFGQVA